MGKYINTFKKFITVNESVEDDNKAYYDNFFNLNRNFKNSANKKKINFSNENSITINNNDNEIKRGYNKIYLNNNEVGGFNISSEIGGEFKDKHNQKTYSNSIFLEGGFGLQEDYKYKGIGKETIRIIFEKTNVDNIFLHTLDEQGAVDFWKKIGGKVIYRNEERGKNLIRIQNK